MSLCFRGALSALAFSAFAAGADATPCYTGQEEPSILTSGEPLTLIAAFTEIRRASPAARAAGLEARALSAEADQAGSGDAVLAGMGVIFVGTQIVAVIVLTFIHLLWKSRKSA